MVYGFGESEKNSRHGLTAGRSPLLEVRQYIG